MSFIYSEFGKIQDGPRLKSFYDKIAVSILKTKLYLLTLYKNKTNVIVMRTGMVIKDSFVSLICYYVVIVQK